MKTERVFRAASVVGLFTMASRGLGLLRDILMAGFFGTSLAMSAFVVAFTIPNLSRRLFGEGALSASFIPVFVETRTKQGDPSAWTLARKIITMVSVLLFGLTLLGEFLLHLAPAVISLSSRGVLILSLLRIMLPYMIFICMVALSMAILNSYGHFALPAATPCLLNLIWIAALALVVPLRSGGPERTIFVVAWAILLAGVIQLLVQLPLLHRFGYRPGFSWDFSDLRVKRVLHLMGPAAFGLALTQFNVLIDRLLAAWIGPWAPAALFFSERLIYFPLGIFATALGTVLLPAFSSQMAAQRIDQMRHTINHSLRSLLFVMIPAAIGLFALARPVVAMIYQWRAFDADSTWFTATALQCYAPGLVIFSLPKVLVPVFYSLQNTRTPLRIGLVAVVLNLLANLFFILVLPLRWKHAGIALATVLAETFFMAMLAGQLRRTIGSFGWKSILSSAIKVLFISLVMGVAAWLVAGLAPGWLGGLGWPEKMVQIAGVVCAMLAGMLLFLLLARLFRCEELTAVLNALRNRRRRAAVQK